MYTGGVEMSLRVPERQSLLEVDFTEVKPCRGHKYFLVVVCTYLGLAEAFPTCTERAREVAKAL